VGLGCDMLVKLFSASISYILTKMGSEDADQIGEPLHSPGDDTATCQLLSATCQLLAVQLLLADCESIHMQGLHVAALEKAALAAKTLERMIEPSSANLSTGANCPA
jgi:hypothetical protein